MSTDAYEKLACGVIEQAVEDVKKLTEAGVIVKGRCAYTAGSWPMGNGLKPRRFFGHYDKPHKVAELIYWFSHSGPLDDFLNFCGVDVTSEAIRQKLGLV